MSLEKGGRKAERAPVDSRGYKYENRCLGAVNSSLLIVAALRLSIA